jgi:hypothetical protein
MKVLFCKTIENPSGEEMLLAHFMVIWEIKRQQTILEGITESIIPSH